MDHLERISKRLADFAEQRVTCDICKAHYARGEFGAHYESERHQRYLLLGIDPDTSPRYGKIQNTKKVRAAAAALSARANQIQITKTMRESARNFNLYTITSLQPLKPSEMRGTVLQLVREGATHNEAINRLARSVGVTHADSVLRYEQIHFPCNQTTK